MPCLLTATLTPNMCCVQGGATPIVIDGDVNGAFENNQHKQAYNGGHISATNGNATHRTDVPNFASNLAIQ